MTDLTEVDFVDQEALDDYLLGAFIGVFCVIYFLTHFDLFSFPHPTPYILFLSFFYPA